jgi:hypothetical protein
MRPISLIAMAGVITVALSGAAMAQGRGGGGGGSHGGGSSPAFRGGGGAFNGGSTAMHSRGFTMDHNVRSNRGGFRRGEERAAFVHRLNNERREHRHRERD